MAPARTKTWSGRSEPTRPRRSRGPKRYRRASSANVYWSSPEGGSGGRRRASRGRRRLRLRLVRRRRLLSWFAAAAGWRGSRSARSAGRFARSTTSGRCSHRLPVEARLGPRCRRGRLRSSIDARVHRSARPGVRGGGGGPRVPVHRLPHVRGRTVDSSGAGGSAHRRPLTHDARGGDLHHRDQAQQRERRPGGEYEQRRPGHHALEHLAIGTPGPLVRDRAGGKPDDRDDHELRENDGDEELDETPGISTRRGPDHRDEREWQEEQRDVDRRVANDHLEPEHERADREDDRAEEDAEQRHGAARVVLDRAAIGVADGLQQVPRAVPESVRDHHGEVIHDRHE